MSVNSIPRPVRIGQIIRASSRASHVVSLPSSLASSKGMSLASRGLLSYILTKPDNWYVSAESLSKELKGSAAGVGAGRDSVTRMLSELEAAGYYRLWRLRGQSDGNFCYHSVVKECPSLPTPSVAIAPMPRRAPRPKPVPWQDAAEEWDEFDMDSFINYQEAHGGFYESL